MSPAASYKIPYDVITLTQISLIKSYMMMACYEAQKTSVSDLLMNKSPDEDCFNTLDLFLMHLKVWRPPVFAALFVEGFRKFTLLIESLKKLILDQLRW